MLALPQASANFFPRLLGDVLLPNNIIEIKTEIKINFETIIASVKDPIELFCSADGSFQGRVGRGLKQQIFRL